DPTAAAYDDFDVTYQGVIEKITEGKTIKIDLRDIRSALTIKSPQKYLDTSDYPDIKDIDNEYLIQEVWGKCFDLPIQCVDANINKDLDTSPPLTGAQG
ncbi:unnamed protein product, partial [marine sediment metagenome]